MEKGLILKLFRTNLKEWYELNGRYMPWLREKNPYKIWISEVILQQTRVAQGWQYYERFIIRFPNVHILAKTDEDEVLRMWQGLGYYSRARNVLRAAKVIVEKHGGIFPEKFNDILELPGIGPYTAGAISSFAFNQPIPVLDGNVYRVISRLVDDHLPIDHNYAREHYYELALEALDEGDSASYNQAIMDFGAIQCLPKQPRCLSCIMNNICLSYLNGTVEILPIKTKKVKIRKRKLHFFWVSNELNEKLIERRAAGDIWEGLYQPLVIEDFGTMQLEESLEDKYGIKISDVNNNYKIQHILTHQRLELHFYSARLDTSIDQKISGLKLCNTENLKNFAFPKPITEYIEKNIYL